MLPKRNRKVVPGESASSVVQKQTQTLSTSYLVGKPHQYNRRYLGEDKYHSDLTQQLPTIRAEYASTKQRLTFFQSHEYEINSHNLKYHDFITSVLPCCLFLSPPFFFFSFISLPSISFTTLADITFLHSRGISSAPATHHSPR